MGRSSFAPTSAGTRTLGLTETCAFAEALAGRADPEDHLVRYGSRLAFAPNHIPARHPAELLQSGTAGQVLDDLEARFQPDVMIFDLPSVLAGDDTRAFLKNVDCALIIARENTTKYSQFDTTEREIAEHTNVLGVVLNACRQRGYGTSAA